MNTKTKYALLIVEGVVKWSSELLIYITEVKLLLEEYFRIF